jgi:hypothetical protein
LHAEFLRVKRWGADAKIQTDIVIVEVLAQVQEAISSVIIGVEFFAGNRPATKWNPATRLEIKLVKSESLAAPDGRGPTKDSFASRMNPEVGEACDFAFVQPVRFRLVV